MSIRGPHVVFTVVAIGRQYFLDAARLLHSLDQCTFHWSALVYTDQREGIPHADCLFANCPGTGFAKLDALRSSLEIEAGPALHVCIDADMELVRSLSYYDIDPGQASLFCARHFLPSDDALWNVRPPCLAYRPPASRAPHYWQSCLWGGYREDLRGLLDRARDLIELCPSKQGAWEEPYLNAIWSDYHFAGRPIATLPVDFACPVWRPSQPRDWKGHYERLRVRELPTFRHYNASRRGGIIG